MSMQRLNNPSQLPQGVVEGYQQQNYNMAAARVGLDTTNPFDNGTTVTVPVGGVVEVNGVMYRITSQWSQTKPNANTAYWIVVVPSADGSTATFALVTRPGVWNPQRQGCYFTNNAQGHNNRRTLNWVSRGTLANIPTGNGGAYSRATKINRDIISLARGWHFVRLESGAGGGNGGNGVGGIGGSAGNGGVANNRLAADMIFFADKPFYNIKVGGSGQNGTAGSTSGNQGSGTVRSGGGGSGSGEESVFDGLSTGMVPPGNGGNGGGSNARPGGMGGRAGNDGHINGGRAGTFLGGGGGGGISDDSGEIEVNPVLGGNGGDGGQSQAEGTAGGSCNIFLLGN